jgi:hypothetical protein
MSDDPNDNRLDLTQWTEIEEVPDGGILAGVVGEDHVFVWRTGKIASRLTAQTAHTSAVRYCRRCDHPMSLASCVLRP